MEEIKIVPSARPSYYDVICTECDTASVATAVTWKNAKRAMKQHDRTWHSPEPENDCS